MLFRSLPLVGRGYLPAAPECTGPVVVAMLDLVVRMLLWCSLLCALPMCSRRTSVRSLERSAAAGFALLAAGGVRARSCVGMLSQENVPRGNFTHIPKERVPSSRRACCSAAVGDVQAAAVRCDAVGVAERDGLGRPEGEEQRARPSVVGGSSVRWRKITAA